MAAPANSQNDQIDWKKISDILQNSDFIENVNDAKIFSNKLKTYCDDDDIDKQTLMHDICGAIGSSNDHDGALKDLLENQMQYDLSKRLKFYKILLYRYINLHELDQTDFCALLHADRTKLNKNKNINIDKTTFDFYSIRAKLDGKKFKSLNSGNEFAEIFADMNIDSQILVTLYNDLLNRWNVKNNKNNSINKPITNNNNNDDKKQDQKQNLNDYCKDRETEINDGLVIFFGISKYKNSINNIDKIGEYRDLYKTVFQAQYNFKFAANDFNKIWIMDDVEAFFQNVTKMLIKSNKIQYNGLIICIVGYGDNQNLICSDGEPLQLGKIMKIFSQNQTPNYGNLPKIIIVDACIHDNNMKVKLDTTLTCKSPRNRYSTIIYNATDHNGDGYLSECITSVFKTNKDKKIKFNEIYKQSGDMLTNRSNDQQYMTLSEHDYRIDDILFEKKKTIRPAILEYGNDDDSDDDMIVPKSHLMIQKQLKQFGIVYDDMIELKDGKKGKIKYAGYVPKQTDTIKFGIELSTGGGVHNGTLDDVYYFDCGDNKGIFVTKDEIKGK